MKICFVAPNIYPCLSNVSTAETIGGAELQQIFIGTGLRDKGYDVSLITQDFGQPQVKIIDNLKVYKTFKEKEGIFGIRFIYPRLFRIWKLLIKADADVYYTRTASFLPGVLTTFCRIYKKKFIFAGASDADFIPKMLNLPTKRDNLLYKYGLKRASAVIVQSATQNKCLWENFGLRGVVIRNFLDAKEKRLQNSDKKYILWVSTIRHLKRPMHFIRLSQTFQGEKFIMIGGRDRYARKLYDEVRCECEKYKNIQFLGFQAFNKTEAYFDRCKVFINTSIYEGFPNTFLQAWRRGIPVISYVDPDNIIKEKKLGLVPNSVQELQYALRSFLMAPIWDTEIILEYFKKNHSSKVIDKYCALLKTI